MQNVQVNQNVNAANFLLVSSQTGHSVTMKEESSDLLDFADVLKNTSGQQKNNTSIDFFDKKAGSNVASKDNFPENSIITSELDSGDANISADAEKPTDVSGSENRQADEEKKVEADVEHKEAEVSEPEVVEPTGQSQGTQQMDEPDEIPEEELVTVFGAIGNLLADVMQQFNLNPDELSAKLEEFGIEMSDLLTKDGLKEFFLQMKGLEVSDLLIDENVNREWMDFLNKVSDELATLETIIPDMDAFVSDGMIEEMFSKLTASSEVLSDVQPVSGEQGELVSMDGPEVVVESEKPYVTPNADNSHNSTNSDDSQSNESTQKNASYESTVTEHGVAKRNTYENPILQAIQNALNNVETTIVSKQPVQQTDILRQVVEQVRVNMNQQQTSLELQLYPEHLGRIQINVVSKEGVMTASIVAETEAAKQAIEAGLLNLKEAMEQQDLKVDAIEVMVSTTGFENGDEQQKSFDEKGSSNPRRKIDITDLGEDISTEDEAEVEKMKASGSSVSYKA